MTLSTKIVIDTCSLLDFFKYYQFDREYGQSEVYDRLIEFLNSKITSKEIIIIDKVYDELYGGQIYIDLFKKIIEKRVEATTFLINNVKDTCVLFLNKIKENSKKFDDITEAMLGKKLDDYENKNADLYLIEYCVKLKSENKEVILITEESKKEDKLLPKIPTICKEKNIMCKTLPYLLFNHYKNELKFNLEIKTN